MYLPLWSLLSSPTAPAESSIHKGELVPQGPIPFIQTQLPIIDIKMPFVDAYLVLLHFPSYKEVVKAEESATFIVFEAHDCDG